MIDVVLCCAPADVPLAHALSAYLELNLDLRIDQAPIPGWQDLLEVVETADDTAAVVSILSPESVPSRWPRERWDALKHPRMAWILAAECPYPPLLKRRAFFDGRKSRAGLFREVRRWLLTRETAPHPPETVPDFVDAPGVAVVDDLHAASLFATYFETTLQFDTRRRTITSLASELAGALGIDRSGDLDALVADCRQQISSRRMLIGLRGPAHELFADAGRSSVAIFDDPQEPLTPPPALALATLVACQKGRAEAPSPADLDRSLSAAFASPDWAVTRELALAGYAFLKGQYRLAEAYDLLASLRGAAQYHGDVVTMNECIIEQSWIGERWSSAAAVADPVEGSQLAFGW